MYPCKRRVGRVSVFRIVIMVSGRSHTWVLRLRGLNMRANHCEFLLVRAPEESHTIMDMM